MQRKFFAVALSLAAPAYFFSSGKPAPARYVSSSACAGCHAEEWQRWQGSDHDLAMDLPSPSSVQARFDGSSFSSGGERSSFRREGDSYWIDLQRATRPAVSYRVRYTFGIDPLQQYLVEFPGGRLQPFPIAWDTRLGRWFDFRQEKPSEDDAFHWTGRYQSWNSNCSECHSTHVEKNYDPDTDTFETTFEEIDVGCQSCHGPGSRHIAWAEEGASGADPQLVAVGREREVDACAACHSHRSRISSGPISDAPFTDQFRPSTLREGLYFADGQIQEEAFEYGSFAQSKMFQRGVTCSDCHDPHGLKTKGTNATCTKCHEQQLDSPAHHRHAAGGEGAKCVSCHMPARIYMGVDARRDHSFRVPRPDLSLAIGAPNACTQNCHLERDDIWAARTVAQWFPGVKAPHYGKIFYRARRGEDVRAELLTLARTSTHTPIVRTTALELLARWPETCREAALTARSDASPLVREAALSCGEALSEKNRVIWAGAWLKDPSRLVRLEAARLLTGVASTQQESAAARAELEARHRAQLDLPDGWFNLAVNAEAEARYSEAAANYRQALALDPEFTPALINLARLEAR